MRTRTLAKIMLAAGVCILLAFGYAALKYGGKPEQEPEIIQTPKAQPPAPEPEPQAPVPAPLEEVKPSVDPKESANAPDASLDPDATAWEKVEHIRNNLHLYGTFHPDADEIIAQLWPPPEDFLNETGGLTESGEFIHDEEAGERVVALFDRLIALNDPRAAELLARYEYEIGRGGKRRVAASAGGLGRAKHSLLVGSCKDGGWHVEVFCGRAVEKDRQPPSRFGFRHRDRYS